MDTTEGSDSIIPNPIEAAASDIQPPARGKDFARIYVARFIEKDAFEGVRRAGMSNCDDSLVVGMFHHDLWYYISTSLAFKAKFDKSSEYYDFLEVDIPSSIFSVLEGLKGQWDRDGNLTKKLRGEAEKISPKERPKRTFRT